MKYLDEQMKHKPTRELFETVYDIAKESNYKKALEVGNCWVITTSAILMAGTGTLLSVDLSEEYEAHKHIKVFGDRVRMWLGERSSVVLPLLIDKGEKYDLISIDGAHDYDNVKVDMENAVQLLAYGGVIVVDDYNHRYNDNSIKDGKHDYGVTVAVDETIKAHNLKYKVYDKANGIIKLWKDEL